MRRILITIVAAIVVVGGLAGVAVATGGGTTVTKTHLEHSIVTSFSNIYTQQAQLIGHQSITPANMHAKAMCDNGAGNSGPGSTWVCLMSWDDPTNPMPSAGYGKFELNVHSNDCYTASGSSALLGYQTIADASGRTVPNPAFEWDACFAPDANNTPTGVTFPSALTIVTTTLQPDTRRGGVVELICGTGAGGCTGTLDFAADGAKPLGSGSFHLAENQTGKVTLPVPIPAGAKQLALSVKYTTGTGSSASTITLEG